jgi:hypothetical protein
MEIFPGISMDPGIRFGKPCVMGTRIDVATVLGGWLPEPRRAARVRIPALARADPRGSVLRCPRRGALAPGRGKPQ